MADPNLHQIPSAEAKARVIKYLGEGLSVDEALKRVGRTRKGYDYWRKNDPEFAAKADLVRNIRQSEQSRVKVPDFETFSREYLHQTLHLHQLRWIDVMEGREPRDLHSSMRFDKGRRDLLLFNVPPEHGKSATLTINYVTWRVICDPNIKIAIISKSQSMAKKMLRGIKMRLENPRYEKLQSEFGPPGGFKLAATSWTETEIYLGGKDDGEKDPTVQALGIGGQIYGARLDIAVLDDVVTLSNAAQWESQVDWISQEVITRLPDQEIAEEDYDRVDVGMLLVAGTRVAHLDLYKQLREQFPGEYTYFAQPAVLEYADDPKDWVTLWPELVLPNGDRKRKWPGPALNRRKAVVPAGTWAMAYQQFDVTSEMTFPLEAVDACVNGMRHAGLMRADTPGHRALGMEGLYVICSMDPATTGHTAALAYAVERSTGKRYVLDVANVADMKPRPRRELIYDWTLKYRPHVWVIEKNAFQKELTQDEDIFDFLSTRGVSIREHQTTGNKWDEDFGVASLAPLFLRSEDGLSKIELPSRSGNAAMMALFEQLTTWAPDLGKKAKTDCVMALWFAEIVAREVLFKHTNQQSHMHNPYLSRGARKRRQVIDLAEQAEILARAEALADAG